MGKLGRFACIFVPMALSIASLVCLILVFSGQLNKNMSIQNNLWFFKADTSKFVDNPNISTGNDQIDTNLLGALQHSASTKDLKDFYQVGLWNYCSGDIDRHGKHTVTYCSPRKASFWFNPVDVWEFKSDVAEKVFSGTKLRDGLETYKKVANWMFIAYVVGLCATAAEIVVGIFAIFSRWGSFVTTIVSTASTIFVFAAAITSTALYSFLAGTFETVLKPYGIKAYVGTSMLSVVWLAAAFSLASGFFWLVSTCCCSGSNGKKKVVVEKTPYTYERVASPYLGGQQQGTVPAGANNKFAGSAYEPFRHERV